MRGGEDTLEKLPAAGDLLLVAWVDLEIRTVKLSISRLPDDTSFMAKEPRAS